MVCSRTWSEVTLQCWQWLNLKLLISAVRFPVKRMLSVYQSACRHLVPILLLQKSAILSVFPKPRESVSLQKSCYVAGSITFKSFSDFLNLAESCQKKAVFVQRHNTSLHSKFRQTVLKLIPKGLDYTQIDTLREPCITDLWFWEVLGQSQSWLRTMQTDLWKHYVNSRIFEFLTACQKSNSCACAKTRLCSFNVLDGLLQARTYCTCTYSLLCAKFSFSNN